MTRRTILGWLSVAAGTIPFPRVRIWAQSATFPGTNSSTLRELATVVLPSELGAAGVLRVADKFEAWVRDYRPGAEMDHGYGFTSIRSKPKSPAGAYMAQLQALREALAAGDSESKRKIVESALVAAEIKELPRAPDGRHVISDLMSFYFHSSDANDLCYRAAIGRDRCRGLEESDNPPPPLKGIAR